MKAWIADTARPIEPFGDLAAALPVLGTPLARVQADTLSEAGLAPGETPPGDEPFLYVGSRCWFTPSLVERFVTTAQERGLVEKGVRLQIVNEDFQSFTEPLQELDEPGLHELAILPNPGASLRDLPRLRLDLDLQPLELPGLPVALAQVGRPSLPVGLDMVHQVDHWSHVLRVNLLALAALGAEAKQAFQQKPWHLRLWMALLALLGARSFNPSRIAQALTQRGRGCRIHPTASVELCRLGNGVEIGPYSVLRGCVLHDDVKVDEHTTLNLSILGPGSRVGRYAMVNLSVLMEGAFVSAGGGFQVCLFGRNSFVAMTASVLDLSFKGDVKVLHRGRRVSSGSPFLGAAIGHRAMIGAGTTIGFGVQIPNDAQVVRDPARILTRWPEGAAKLVKV